MGIYLLTSPWLVLLRAGHVSMHLLTGTHVRRARPVGRLQTPSCLCSQRRRTQAVRVPRAQRAERLARQRRARKRTQERRRPAHPQAPQGTQML